MSSLFLRRVRLRNYKSIAACDVELRPLTMLVGPNGSGKSNFIDGLRLVADALNQPLDHALRHRGGIDEVRRRSTGHPHNFAIELDFQVPGGPVGRYSFEVAARGKGGFVLKHESLDARTEKLGNEPLQYDVREGVVVRSSVPHPPAAAPDRLYLTNLAGIPGFRQVYDAFTSMGFYNLDPVQIRSIQSPDPGGTLARDGLNLASVVWRLSQEDPSAMEMVREYLAKIVFGIESVERIQVANKETLEFRQAVKGSNHPWRWVCSRGVGSRRRRMATASGLMSERGRA
jgi:predicted ATPase